MTINDDRSDPVQLLGEMVYASWKGDGVQVPGAWIPSAKVWWIRKSSLLNKLYGNMVRSNQRCTLTSANALKKTLTDLESTGVITQSQRRNMTNAVKAVLRIHALALIDVIFFSMLSLVIAATAAIILPLLLIEPWTAAAGFAVLTPLITILVILGYNGLVQHARNKSAMGRLLLVFYLCFGISGLFLLFTRRDYSASSEALTGLIAAAVGIYLVVSVFINTVLSLRLRRRSDDLWNDSLIYRVLNVIHMANEHADQWDTRKVKTTVSGNLDQVRDLITRHLAQTISGALPGGRPAAEQFARSAAAAVTELKAQLMRADGRTVVLVRANQYLLTLLREAWLELPTSEPASVRKRSPTETARMLLGAAAGVILVWVLQRFGVVPSEYSGLVWAVVLGYAAFTIISAIDPRLDERLQAFLKIGSSLRALRDNKADEE